MATTKGDSPPTQPPTSAATKTGGGGDDDGQPIMTNVAPDTEDAEGAAILKRRIDLLRGELAESRLPGDYEFSFNPSSMVGSWFHRLENDRIVWQGVVVGEPKAGTYLVQIDRLDVGAENVQRLIPLEKMVTDEDGYDWRFYDSQQQAQEAFAAWVVAERERVS